MFAAQHLKSRDDRDVKPDANIWNFNLLATLCRNFVSDIASSTALSGRILDVVEAPDDYKRTQSAVDRLLSNAWQLVVEGPSYRARQRPGRPPNENPPPPPPPRRRRRPTS